MPFILSGNVGSATAATGFDVDNSVRFNSVDSASMEKDAAAPTDNNKWTFSAWVKRSKFGGVQEIFYGEANSTNYCTIRFNDADNTLTFKNRPGSTTSTLTTSAIFKDPSAWYHLVVVLDTSNGTAANRDIIYINGVRETNYGLESHSGDGDACYINSDGDAMKISKGNSASFFDGYMAEIYFIDGQALAASDFGEFDDDSPTIWKPIDASGLTFGNNGFYLDFKASGNLGNDANGGTDLTETNLAAVDQSTDTCTNNFATFNPIYKSANQPTYTEGNTIATSSGSGYRLSFSTIAASTGKWYAEFKRGAGEMNIGISSLNDAETLFNVTDLYLGETAKSLGIAYNDGDYIIGGSQTAYGAVYADGTTLGIALDLTNKKLYASKNGAWSNGSGAWDSATFNAGTGDIDISSVIPSGEYAYFGCSNTGTSTVSANFGSPPYAISSGNADGNGFGNFEYAPPSGYFALCTKNLGSDGG